MKFREYLTENESYGKLVHIEHAEDHIFHGEEGYHHATKVLHAVNDRVQGAATAAKLTTKYDGSPSIVFGYDPISKKFFVGTKAALSQKPTLNFSESDIKSHYGDRPELADVLTSALENLKKVVPDKGVYQGDVMYTKDRLNEDNRHYHFTPNTIMYSAKKSDPHGKLIKDAHLGLVVHTKYHGKDLSSMVAGFEPDLHNFKNSKDVHVIDPVVPVEKSLLDQEGKNKFDKHMLEVEKERLNGHPDMFMETVGHGAFLKKYVNDRVKKGEDGKPTPQGFKQFMTDLFTAEAEKLKTPAGKLRKKEQLLVHIGHVDEHHDKYNSLLNIHHNLTEAKNSLIEGLDKTNPFECSVDGEECPGEGFVAVHKGFPSKLVNRSHYSKRNFDKHAKKS
jgi:hypothetical protein